MLDRREKMEDRTEFNRYLRNISDEAKDQVITTLLFGRSKESRKLIKTQIKEFNKMYPKLRPVNKEDMGMLL